MILDRRWLIKDGNLSDKTIEYIKAHKGEYELIFKKHVKRRTEQQNRALHLYFQQLSEALNQDGFDVRVVISSSVDMMWTPYLVKELLWRATQKALFGKQSTTQLRKVGEIEKVYDVINKIVGERTGVYVPFPSMETLYEQDR